MKWLLRVSAAFPGFGCQVHGTSLKERLSHTIPALCQTLVGSFSVCCGIITFWCVLFVEHLLVVVTRGWLCCGTESCVSLLREAFDESCDPWRG